MSFIFEPPQWAAIAARRPLADLLDFAIVTVDKHAGPTSHTVTAMTCRVLKAQRAGHGGTLDPAVTGVLPVFLGRATRLSSLILKGGKEYAATARFHGDVGEEILRETVKAFTGEILQKPPVRSRVKRVERTRTVHRIEILGRDGRDVEMIVECSAGTYVRKLVHDMGEKARTGAHMSRLRRTRAGPFSLDRAAPIEEIAAAREAADRGDESRLRELVLPGEFLAGSLCSIVIDEGAVGPVSSGSKLAGPGVLSVGGEFAAGEIVGIFAPDGTWIAMGEALVSSAEIIPGKKGLVAIPRRVLVAVKPGNE